MSGESVSEFGQGIPIEQREAFLHHFAHLGSFTGEAMGIPNSRSDAVLIPTRELNYLEAHGKLRGIPNPIVRDDVGILLPFTVQGSEDIARIRPFIHRIGVGGDEARKIVNRNWALMEESFLMDTFGDMGDTARMLFAYDFIQSQLSPREQQLPKEKKLAKIEKVIHQSGLLQYFPDTSYSSNGYVGQWNEKTLAEVIDNFHDNLSVIARGSDLDIDTLQAAFRDYTQLIVPLGEYLYAVVKTGDAPSFFVDQKNRFSPPLLLHAVVAYAKAESATFHEKPEEVAVWQSRYSTSVNLLADATIQQISTMAFAFGNAAILEKVGMPDRSYLYKARVTGANPNLEEVGNLQAVKEAFALPDDKAIKTRTHKSVYTALAEAISIHKKEFNKLLVKYGITIPAAVDSFMQMEQDFYAIAGLHQLLLKWQTAENSDIDVLLQKMYDTIQSRPDLVRGSIYPPDENVNAIVREAVEKGVEMRLVLNNYADGSSHPQVYTIHDMKQIEDVAKSLGIEITGENRSEIPTLLLHAYYSAQTQPKNNYPYAAFHIVGTSSCEKTLWHSDEEPTVYETELRIVPFSERIPATIAREVYKGYGSRHVVKEDAQE